MCSSCEHVSVAGGGLHLCIGRYTANSALARCEIKAHGWTASGFGRFGITAIPVLTVRLPDIAVHQKHV